MSKPSPMRGVKAGPALDNSDRSDGWPKGLRRLKSISFLVDQERKLVHLFLRRVNRGTGWVDSTDVGAMSWEDFTALSESIAQKVKGENPSVTLIERLGYKLNE